MEGQRPHKSDCQFLFATIRPLQRLERRRLFTLPLIVSNVKLDNPTDALLLLYMQILDDYFFIFPEYLFLGI